MLHVSVWVEIAVPWPLPPPATSCSTWACELKYTRHKFYRLNAGSCSTWACELKCEKTGKLSDFKGHAPRERVSWNIRIKLFKVLKVVMLHVSVWVEIYHWNKFPYLISSCSTWACELKWRIGRHSQRVPKSCSTWACELKYFVKWYT